MAITRSANKQTHLEDFAASTDSKTTKEPKPSEPSKRKANTSAATTQPIESAPSKRPRPTTPSQWKTKSKPKSASRSILKSIDKQQPSSGSSPPIKINRSSVLHLWAACVASTLHADLLWQACVNVGSAIASLCAVTKGKAIGMIEVKDKAAIDEQGQGKGKKQEREWEKMVEVMGFKLTLKGDVVLLSGQEKSAKEELLRGKFGGEEVYEDVKKVMLGALGECKGREEELGGKAFEMYEKFRPSVPKGEGGWGRKGELDLEKVREVVTG